VQLKVRPLMSLLDEHALRPNRSIWRLDVEGLSLDVLTQEHWPRFQPTVVIAEVFRQRSYGSAECYGERAIRTGRLRQPPSCTTAAILWRSSIAT